MQIDGTRLKAFWTNPERYRLAYQLDIVPAQTSYGLARGIVFHTAINQYARGESHEHVLDVVHGRTPDYDGRVLAGLTPLAIENGLNMARAYENNKAGYEILASELEFDFEIPGSPHRGIGRIDQIIQDSRERERVLEFKTGSAKTQYSRKVDEWASDMQADFELLGAGALGFKGCQDHGVEVQYVLEKNPPLVWQPIYVTRSEAQLKRAMLFIHQTCETILMYKATFGLEQPWPHLGNWPCNGDCGYCGYETVCGTQGKIGPDSFGPAFKQREEHLEILRVIQ